MKKVMMMAFPALLMLLPWSVSAQQAQSRNAMARRVIPQIQAGNDGVTFTEDAQGNRVPDYSYCGYHASEKAVPFVPVKAFVQAKEGDRTADIQAAIDYVSGLPVGEDGFRGAIQLEKGVFEVSGGLKISASGVVLRGSGGIKADGKDYTEIVGTGDDRTTLVRIAGRKDRRLTDTLNISEAVPTGAMSVVVPGHGLKAGDRIRVNRLCTQEWIDQMDMNAFGGESSYIGWKPGDNNGRPGDVDIHWDRTIMEIQDDRLILDAPITCRIEVEEGSVCPYAWPGRISNVGLENICLTSAFDKANPKDENHRWMAVEVDNVEDAWVRRVECRHFAGSAVFVTENGSRVTVQECKNLDPVSEIGGERRNAFFTMGGQCLILRCYAEDGLHDFATGRCTPGPTAFVECFDSWPNHFSGSASAWSTGILFDVFTSEGGALSYANRGQDGIGSGWTAANSMMWNCHCSFLASPMPPTAYNWANGIWGQRAGNASWGSTGSYVKPHSLFYALLAARGAANAGEQEQMMPFDTQSASNPPVDKAQVFVAEARKPALQLTEWMDTLSLRNPIPTEVASDKLASVWQKRGKQSNKAEVEVPKMHLENGILVRDGKILTGSRRGIVWWNGSLKERYTYNAVPHITRYAPGRTGRGFTDDLDEMTDQMRENHVLITDHHYGLWYDRRRDDHERVRRMDGYVWPPFYELPFARSGQGIAYDGLSKYDLTKWNVWYWNRLKKYADLADEKGLVLYHQNYFQHNILEAGAHWADFPWRSANNVNEAGFPEPVPYVSDKRIYMADLFYDVSNKHRAELHRNYIRKCLDNFADNGSVIQFISEEFTGPLHFVQFWLDVIAEWEAETGLHPLIALSATKDVQDAILADPERARVVDIIDMKYWSPSMNGFNAPAGGQSLAPRQSRRGGPTPVADVRKIKAKTMDERSYETVADYRTRFPEKAFICSSGADGWSAFMGGASLCSLPAGLPEAFLKLAASCQPLTAEEPNGCWLLGNPEKGYIAYARGLARVDLSRDRNTYSAQWLDPQTGETRGESFRIKGGSVYESEGDGVLWLSR